MEETEDLIEFGVASEETKGFIAGTTYDGGSGSSWLWGH